MRKFNVTVTLKTGEVFKREMEGNTYENICDEVKEKCFDPENLYSVEADEIFPAGEKPKLYAVGTMAGNRKETQVLESTDYSSKTKYAEILRGNGFKVRFIFNDADYDKVMARIKTTGFHMLTKKEGAIYQIING